MMYKISLFKVKMNRRQQFTNSRTGTYKNVLADADRNIGSGQATSTGRKATRFDDKLDTALKSGARDFKLTPFATSSGQPPTFNERKHQTPIAPKTMKPVRIPHNASPNFYTSNFTK